MRPMRLGLHFDSSSIRASLASKKKISILPNVKQLYIKNFRNEVISALSAREVLIKPITAKNVKGKHADEAIAFQIEAMSHQNLEEVISVLAPSKKYLVMVNKKALKDHLDTLGIDPDAVTIIPSALCHFAKYKFPEMQSALICDLRNEETTCVLMEDGELKKMHLIPFGIKALLDAFFEDRKKTLLREEIEPAAAKLDLLHVKPGFHLSAILTHLRQEITRAFYAFAKEEKKAILVTGKSDIFMNLESFLVTSPEPGITQEEKLHAVAVGASLDPLQLRCKEFFPEKNWRKIGIYAASLFALSFFLSASLIGFALWQRKTTPAIEQWISDIEVNKKEFPYLLEAPNVTETLALPLLRQVELREMHYELIKQKETPQAKITIEFTCQNSTDARKFHETLRIDPAIDAKKEISWDTFEDHYRASFYLKNREPYVF
jgi:hypothetical protein